MFEIHQKLELERVWAASKLAENSKVKAKDTSIAEKIEQFDNLGFSGAIWEQYMKSWFYSE
jgi:hypothetical protein